MTSTGLQTLLQYLQV